MTSTLGAVLDSGLLAGAASRAKVHELQESLASARAEVADLELGMVSLQNAYAAQAANYTAALTSINSLNSQLTASEATVSRLSNLSVYLKSNGDSYASTDYEIYRVPNVATYVGSTTVGDTNGSPPEPYVPTTLYTTVVPRYNRVGMGLTNTVFQRYKLANIQLPTSGEFAVVIKEQSLDGYASLTLRDVVIASGGATAQFTAAGFPATTVTPQ